MESNSDPASFEPIIESRVVLQLVVEITDAGPRVTFRSSMEQPVDKAGIVYGAAISTIVDALQRCSANLNEAEKLLMYTYAMRTIEHGGTDTYLRSLMQIIRKEADGEQPGRAAD